MHFVAFRSRKPPFHPKATPTLLPSPLFIKCVSFTEEQSSCLATLRYALNAHSGKRSAYIPRCRNDGTYAAVQCAAAGAAAGCWCVTPDGKPLPDTAVRNGKPDCSKTGEYSVQLVYSTAGWWADDRAQSSRPVFKFWPPFSAHISV